LYSTVVITVVKALVIVLVTTTTTTTTQHSLISSQEDMCRPTYTQHLWWQKFRCCRSAGVEQSTTSAATGYQLRTIQTTTENISVRD